MGVATAKPRNLMGLKVGRLTIVEFIGHLPRGSQNYWRCECECGGEKVVAASQLSRGKCRSCGCLEYENQCESTKTHGLSHVPEYEIWCDMRKRCSNPKHKFWHRYGGRGISVCERWQSFENFYADMGPRPSALHKIDRNNNDGDYEPGNCTWELQKAQARNTSTNRRIEYNGQVRCMTEWAEIYGLTVSALHQRLTRLKWPIEKALLTPYSYAPRKRCT
jgi:hypothetical protein